jgi:predicted Zn-dependent protease
MPEMTYESMPVANGQDAGIAWESLERGRLEQTEWDRIEKALRAYCGQDTMAMVRLVEQLQRSSLT